MDKKQTTSTTTTSTTTINNNNNTIPTLVKRVTTLNFDIEIKNFENDLKDASFISIDTEFTGLGYQKGLKLDDIQEKYNSMANLVKQRSILEFGISIFKANFEQDLNCNPQQSSSNTDKEFIQDYNLNNNNKDEELGEVVLPSTSTSATTTNNNKTTTTSTTTNTTTPTNNNTNTNTNTNTTNKKEEKNYTIRVYNFLMLNISDFLVTPNSLTFLSKHGFDFKELFLYGIPFQSKRPVHNHNNSNTTMNSTPTKFSIAAAAQKLQLEETLSKSKLLIDLLTKVKLPAVIHNGVFDLLFLYQSLIGDLPDKLNDFISKVQNVFPIIYDTKYIAEYKICEKRSYLQYLFQKYERLNFNRKTRNEVYLSCDFKSFDHIEETDQQQQHQQHYNLVPLVNIEYSFIKEFLATTKICTDFADYGHCKFRDACLESHDISLILDQEDQKTQKKKRRRNKFEYEDENGNSLDGSEDNENDENKNNNNNTTTTTSKYREILKMEGQNIHSAGFDSAMTGFIFTYYLSLFTNSNLLSEVENKIFLSGKQTPLVLKVSKYA